MKKFWLSTTALLILSACASITQTPPSTLITVSTKQVPIPTNTIQPTITLAPTSEPLMFKVSEFGQGIVFDHAISPDGKRVAIGSSSGLYVYDAEKKEILQHFTANAPEDVLKVTYSSNGEYIVYASIPSNNRFYITVIQISNEKILIRTTVGHNINHIAFSRDNKYLLIVSAVSDRRSGCDSYLEVWDIQNSQKIKTLQQPSNLNTDQYFNCRGLNNAVISRDDQIVFSGFDGGLVAWNLNTGEQIYYIPAYSGLITTILFDPINNTVITGDSGGAIRYWDAATGKNFKTISALGKNINSIKLSDDSKQLIVKMDNEPPATFEYLTGKLIGQVDSSLFDLIWENLIDKLFQDGFFTIRESKIDLGYTVTTEDRFAFSKDGHSLAIGCAIVNSSTGKLVTKLINCKDDDFLNALSFGENYLATDGASFSQDINGEHFLGRGLKLWNSLTGELLIDQPVPHGVYSLSFSVDSGLLAVGASDYISLWDTTTKHLIKNFYPAAGAVQYVGFQNNDQQLIVVTTPNYLISRFNIKSGKLLALIRPTLPDDVYPYGQVYISGNKMVAGGLLMEIGTDTATIKLKYGDTFSPLPIMTSNERILIVLDREGLSFIDINTGKELYKFNTPMRTYPIISPDQKHIAFLAPGGKIQIWDISRILESASQ